MFANLFSRNVAVPLALAVFASLATYAIAVVVIQKATLNADETSYVFQANNFLDGRVSRPCPPYPDAFRHKMIITSPEVGWLSRYSPGHSLFLVPGVLIGDPYLLVALAAGLSLVLVYFTGRILADRRTAAIAGLLMLFSPFFLFYSATLLSHPSSLLATAAMLASYVYWRQTGDARFAVLAGLAWAWFFTNRSYTALLIALPFAMDSLWQLYRERTLRMLYETWCFATASFSGVLGLLFYNYLSVGNPWTMTYLYYTSTQALGFGPRNHGRVEHTFARGVEILTTNVSLLNVWLWGFVGSLAVFTVLAIIGWKKRWTPLFIGCILSVWLGYIYFFYQGPRDAGPSYYFELLPFFALGAAFGIRKILDHVRLRYVLAVMCVWLGVSTVFIVDAGKDLRERNAPRRQVLDALQDAPKGSIVFISSQEHYNAFRDGNDMVFNPRGLDGQVLVAHYLDNTNQAVIRHFSQYTPLKLTRKNSQLIFEPMPRRMSVDIPIGIFHRLTGENISIGDDGKRLIRSASQGDHPADVMLFGRYYHLYPGKFVVEFDVRASSAMDDFPVLRLDVASDKGRTILASRDVTGDGNWTTQRFEFTIDSLVTIEPRAFFLGNGEAQVAAVRINEID